MFDKDEAFAAHGTYHETWAFIKEGVHSLERHSNLGIGLPEQRVVGSLRLRRLNPLQTGIFIKGRIDLELPRAISNPGVTSKTPPCSRNGYRGVPFSGGMFFLHGSSRAA